MSSLKIKSTDQLQKNRRMLVSILLFLLLTIQFIVKFTLSHFELNTIESVIEEVIMYTFLIFILSIIFNILIELKNTQFLRHRNIKFLRLRKDLNNTFINRDIYNTLKSDIDNKV